MEAAALFVFHIARFFDGKIWKEPSPNSEVFQPLRTIHTRPVTPRLPSKDWPTSAGEVQARGCLKTGTVHAVGIENIFLLSCLQKKTNNALVAKISGNLFQQTASMDETLLCYVVPTHKCFHGSINYYQLQDTTQSQWMRGISKVTKPTSPESSFKSGQHKIGSGLVYTGEYFEMM